MPKRPRAGRAACAPLALLLLAAPALAQGTLALELSGGGAGGRAWSLLGDVELVPAEAFVSVGYLGARPAAGAGLTHQLVLGLDRAVGERWLLSAQLGAGAAQPTEARVERGELLAPLVLRTGHASAGLTLAAAYERADAPGWGWVADASLGVTGYLLRRELTTARATCRSPERLAVVRPALGLVLLPSARLELTVRAAGSVYSQDPLATGGFFSESNRCLPRDASGAVRPLFEARVREQLGADRLAALDAEGGFPAAPVRWEVRPGVGVRLSRPLKLTASYALARYVGREGYGHVLAARVTGRTSDVLRLWLALALQLDVVPDRAPARSGLLTLGGEYGF